MKRLAKRGPQTYAPVKSEIYPQITQISADFFSLLARAKGRAARRRPVTAIQSALICVNLWTKPASAVTGRAGLDLDLSTDYADSRRFLFLVRATLFQILKICVICG
jgi:hypothetical protein